MVTRGHERGGPHGARLEGLSRPVTTGRPRPAGRSRLLRRAPLLAAALVALLGGLWAGLLRLGIDLPPLRPELASLHGPLLVLGFLGTQIGLERAVALRRRPPWPYFAPIGAAAGSTWLLVGLPTAVGQVLFALGGIVLCAVFLAVHRIDPTAHNAVMGLGAAAWAAGAIVWLVDEEVARAVPFLVAFLVLTIVGERLELSRMGRPAPLARAALLAAIALFACGVVATLPDGGLGVRLAGTGMLAQAAWLARYDVARRTIRIGGVTRFMAVALLAGYLWLAVAGVLWIHYGSLLGAGSAYDAMLHAVFLGFVFSMVFAHAPVIVPAVLGVALPYRRAMYGPLVLLHGGLVLRVVGDLAGNVTAWRWGGVLDEAAILAFLALAVATAATARRRPTRARIRPR
jgi:hypothetical protein